MVSYRGVLDGLLGFEVVPSIQEVLNQVGERLGVKNTVGQSRVTRLCLHKRLAACTSPTKKKRIQ